MAPVIALMLEASHFLHEESHCAEAGSSTGEGWVGGHMETDGQPGGSQNCLHGGTIAGGAAGGACHTKVSHSPFGAVAASRAALNSAGNWGFCTVAVFTCGAACSPAGQGGDQDEAVADWQEEWVAAVMEEESHKPLTEG